MPCFFTSRSSETLGFFDKLLGGGTSSEEVKKLEEQLEKTREEMWEKEGELEQHKGDRKEKSSPLMRLAGLVQCDDYSRMIGGVVLQGLLRKPIVPDEVRPVPERCEVSYSSRSPFHFHSSQCGTCSKSRCYVHAMSTFNA